MFHGTLHNGLELVSVARPWSPLVVLRLCLRVGSACENPDEHGLAHVLEHVLLHRRFAAGYLVDAWTTKDTTVYGATVPRGEAVRAARALIDTVLRIDVDDAALREELSRIRQERAHRENDPQWRLREELLARLWQATSYAHPILGDREVLDRLTAARVRQFHTRWYQPANAVLVLVGDTGQHELAARLGGNRAGQPAPTPQAPGGEHRTRGPLCAARAALAVVGQAGSGVTTGVAFPACPKDEPEQIAHRLAQRITATTSLSMRQIRVRGGGATWLTRSGRTAQSALADMAALLRSVEHRLSTRAGAALLADARVVELRTAERPDEVATRVAEQWLCDRRGYDDEQWYTRLMRIEPSDVVGVVADLRARCETLLPRLGELPRVTGATP